MCIACQTQYEEPKIALDNYVVEDGFQIKAIASEPLLTAPVAIDFDTEGRIWVAEMTGFMTDLDGTEEQAASGSIKILEDKDKDGVMDHATVFIDSLVMPRALALVYGGLLYVESPNLWFVEIKDNKPANRVLVDSLYATSGNPEHQPNGLLLNVDNWIYNANMHFKYQRKKGKWLKEPTSFRGQWGITKDNYGHLFYNNNSRQLLGDYVLPNQLINNPYYIPRQGLNKTLTPDQKVYPLQPTLVNRGYSPGVLDKDSMLIEVTAACGPLVYRGDNFPSNYVQNAFVCVPEANLIKRNILTYDSLNISAKQAEIGKEFLASYDEGFRPVNLNNGPDGSLYVVDMHRGVIQHQAFLSSYLKEKSAQKGLDTIVNYGRILKVERKESTPLKTPDFSSLSAAELANLLTSSNGWIRDKAQHYIIYQHKTAATEQLKKLATNTATPITQIHALYTLEGLDKLSFNLLKTVAQQSNPNVIAHALTLLQHFVDDDHISEAHTLYQGLLAKKVPTIALYLSSTIGKWMETSSETFSSLWLSLGVKYQQQPLIAEALTSASTFNTEVLYEMIAENENFESSALVKAMKIAAENKASDKQNSIYTRVVTHEDNRTTGSKLFRQICAACHSVSGEGIEGLAPPLAHSEYMTSEPEKLARILLYGLRDTVHVNGETYFYNHVMPGLKNNQDISNKDISDIISYITNAFSPRSLTVSEETVEKLRNETPENGAEYTEKELKTLYPNP